MPQDLPIRKSFSWTAIKLAAETFALLALGGSAVYVAWDLHQTQVQVRTGLSSFSTAIDNLNSTIVKVNAPCAPGPCGMLAEIDKSAVKLQDITVTLQKQVNQSSQLVNAASQSLTQVSAHLDTTADALTGTASQVTKLTAALTEDAQTANSSIAAIKPLLSDSDATIKDVDAFVKSPDVIGVVHNADGVLFNTSAILADGKAVADDATKKYFQPEPWYRKVVPFATTGAKIASYALPW